MKSWTYFRIFILSFILSACSRNPLGEDLKQPILNLAVILSQTCTNNFNQDTLYSCQINTSEPLVGLTWSLNPATTCSWATINAITGLITGTPNDNQVGNCNLVVDAATGKSTASPLTVAVQVKNVAPTLTIANPLAPIFEGDPATVIRNDASVQASEEGFGVYSFDNANTTLPRCFDNASTLSINPATGAVTFGPAPLYNGTCFIRVAFDDQNGAANSVVTAEFSVVVDPINDPPVITPIGTQNTNESTPLVLNFTVTDPDSVINCATGVTATSSNVGLVPNANIVLSGMAPNCTATITPINLLAGSTTITLNATDGFLTDTKSFLLNVVAVNNPPVMSAITNQTISEDNSVAVNFTITDVDNILTCSGLNLSAASSNTGLLPVANIVFGGVAPNCTATLTPVANGNGVTNVSLTVNDNGVPNLMNTKTFSLTVNAINDPPTIAAITNKTTNEDIPIVVNFTIADVDNALSCTTSMSATSSNTGLVPVANIVFSGTAPNCAATINMVADQNGISNIGFYVTDGTAIVGSLFSLTVTPVNDAPVMSAIGNQITSQDVSVAVNFTITDVDSTLNCATSVSATSSNVALLPVANIVFSGTAPNCTATMTNVFLQNGSSNVSFTVTDGALTHTRNFTYTATAVNYPPVLSAISNQTVSEDNSVAVNFTITDVDSVLTCTTSMSATSSNLALLPVASIVFTGTAPNCTATITPLANQNGTSNLSFTVSDGSLTNVKNFTLTVNAVNDAPVMSVISNQTISEDNSVAVNFTINDVDSALTCTTSVSATSSNTALLPVASIVFSGTAPNCTATITPLANQNGISNLSFTVTDGSLTDVKNFSLTVTAVNDPPVMSAISNQTISEDNSVAVNFTINDPDSVLTCATSVSATSSNVALLPIASIVFSGTAPNCTATLTPLANQNGLTNLSFTVTDGSLTDVKNFSLTVNAVNDPPVISAISNQIVSEDVSLGVGFTITDVDNTLNCATSMSATSSNTALLPVANIVFSGTAPNCSVTMTPLPDQNGLSNIVLTVTDGTTLVTSSFSLTVNPVNDAPVMSAITNKTNPQDTPLVVNFTITDVDSVLNCATSVSATSSNVALLPVANITFAGTAPNCTATLNPVNLQTGVTNLSFTVTDGSLTDVKNFTYTVTATNYPPVLSAISNQTISEDNSVAVNFTITDLNDVLNCTTSMSATSSNLALLPVASIVFTGTAPNCTATITPLADQNGTSNLSFTVTDGSLTDVKNFTLTVNAVNDAPVMSVISNQTVSEDNSVAVNFTINDVDSTLTCATSVSATSSNTALLPIASIVFSGTAPNCTATLTPLANQNGLTNLSFTVTDGSLTDVKNFSLTVNAVNDPPVMSAISNQTISEDNSVAVNFTINDPDSVLTCTTSVSATSSNTTLLPVANVVFSGTAPNCTATLSSALNQNGLTNLSFTVTDGSLTDVKNFSLTVNAVNDAPVMSAITNQTVSEDNSLAVNFTITDVDSTLTCATSVSATSSNTALLPVASIVFSGTAPNCTATLTPLANQNGLTNLSFTVTDGSLTDVKNFSLTVNAVNDSPVISAVTNQTMNEDNVLAVNFTITDVDNVLNCATSMSATSSHTTLLPVANIVFSGTAPNCTATLSPALNQNGVTNLSLIVTDGTTSVSSNFTLTVTAVNDAPVLSSISNQTISEDNTSAVNFTITDVDSTLLCTSLNLSVTSSNTTLLPIANVVWSGTAPNCTAALTPAADQNGTTNLTVTVSDNGAPNLQDAKTFTLTVTAVNDAPVISAIVNQTTNEDVAKAINFTITDVDNVLDCTTSMTASTSNTTLVPVANIVFSGTAPNCTATITPAANLNGVLNITFRVSDGVLFLDQTFQLTVNAVDDAPVISVISNQSTNESTPFTINFTITDIDSTLNCTTSMSSTSSNTALIPTSNIVFSGTAPNCIATVTPIATQNGVTNVGFIVNDGTTAVTQSFSITVIAVNDPPVMSALVDQNTNESTPISVNFTITDPDNTLTCATSVSATSSNTTLIPVANIVFSGTAPNCTATMTPVTYQNGTSNISFIVTDGSLTDTKSFVLTVNPMNDPPVISTLFDDITNEDTNYVANFTITDPDNILSCTSSMSATTADGTLIPVANVVFSGTAPNCVATITPAANGFGATDITLTVTDGSLQASTTFNLTVSAVNDAPTINTIPAQSTSQNVPITLNFTINDVDNTLSCNGSVLVTSSNATLLPAASSFVFSGTVPNCVATITPAANKTGSSNVNFFVTDGVAVNSRSFTVTVAAAVIPSAFAITSAVPGNAQVDLAWGASTNATTYTVKYGTSSGSFPTTFATGVVGTTTTVTGLTNNTTYYFMVQAVNANGTKNANVEMSARPGVPTLSAVADQTTPTLSSNWSSAVTFTLGGVSTLGCATDVVATSSNNAVVSNGSLSVTGTYPNCTLTFNIGASVSGSSNITLTATNGSVNATRTFALNVLPQAAVAYSTRRVVMGYTGKLMNVRHGSNNAEADVAFDSAKTISASSQVTITNAGTSAWGVNQTMTFSSFYSGANVYVKTWYDQSGNGLNVTQATAANQASIYSAGSFSTLGSGIGLQFNGTTSLAASAGANIYGITADRTLSVVFRLNSGSPSCLIDRTSAGNPLFGLSYQNLATAPQLQFRNDSNANLTYLGTAQVAPYALVWTGNLDSGGTSTVYYNGASNGSAFTGTSATMSPLLIGRHVSNAATYDANISEVVLFPAAINSTDRLNFERNQGAWFGITVP